MDEGILAVKARETVIGTINRVIKKSSNPDALVSLLYTSRNGGVEYVSSIANKLGISNEDIRVLVLDELLPLGLVKTKGECDDFHEFCLDDSVNELIAPPPWVLEIII